MNYTALLAVLLRSLVLISFIVLVAFLSSLVRRAIPSGRLKRFLTRPMNVVPQSDADRSDWWPVAILLLLAVLLLGGIAWMTAAA